MLINNFLTEISTDRQRSGHRLHPSLLRWRRREDGNAEEAPTPPVTERRHPDDGVGVRERDREDKGG